MTQQLTIPKLTIKVAKEVQGLEMGVLSDNSSYFSGRALSKLCGVANSSISEATTDWASGKKSSNIAKYLISKGFNQPGLYTETSISGVAGNAVYAYRDDVSNLILAYYAMEVGNETAKKNFLQLSQAGLRLFVFHSLGYDPQNVVPIVWKHLHERVILVTSPKGYFSVFREMLDFVIAVMRGGLPNDQHTVPDISVGRAWSTWWEEKGLAAKHGERLRFDHNYPSDYPQSDSNPQEIWVYPLSALGDFRTWLQDHYVPLRFPKYLATKVKNGTLPPSIAQLLLEENTPELLPAAG